MYHKPDFYKVFTIEQLDKFKACVTKLKWNLVEKDENFVSAYFSKVFSNELSEENQDSMTPREKFDTLLRLHEYAKKNELPKTLISNLVHEILALSIKMEDYRTAIFKDYLKMPLERNMYLKKEKVRNEQQQSNYTKWNNCLNNVQTESKKRYAKVGWHQPS